MLSWLIQGLALGFSAGASPGPLQTYFFSQSIRNGWKKTLPAAFAPVVSDGPIIALVLLVLTQTPAWFLRSLHFVGGGYILYLAWQAFVSFRKHTGDVESLPDTKEKALVKATFMNLVNPNPYIFWSTTLGPSMIVAWKETLWHAVGLVGAFYGAMIGLSITLIILFASARHLGGMTVKYLLGISSFILLGYGVYQIWLGISG